MPSTSTPSTSTGALAQPRIATVLVTAGPTEEPIDEVRFLGNRSSGRLGVALAEEFAAAGHAVTLLLGPVRVTPPSAGAHASGGSLRVVRFRSSRDLATLLTAELPLANIVVMAAAVADYRPRTVSNGKMRREAGGLTLELESVPDLLATTAAHRMANARVYGFALEPRERLEQSAREKLERKNLCGIVANPLETMDAADIDGTLFLRDGSVRSPGARLEKRAFARWLVHEISPRA
jgi:phosphopantothenoylcysteine decarboxylase/phosphopantothenate--cysteine ligase